MPFCRRFAGAWIPGWMVFLAVWVFVPPIGRSAEAIDPKAEKLGDPLYRYDFGAQGQGDDTLEETGIQKHGAYANGVCLRFFDGAKGGTQTNGVYVIALKNAGAQFPERITDHIPVQVPAVGGELFGGGKFDGTALWLGHSRFKRGEAPPIGDDGKKEGTRWDGNPGIADAGCDVRVRDNELLSTPVSEGAVIRKSWLISAQVYVPDHALDEEASTRSNYFIHVQPFTEREGAGLTTPGGLGYRCIRFAVDTWQLLQIRVDVVTQGSKGASITYTYFLDREPEGKVDTFDLTASGWYQKKKGPVHVGFAAGVLRGWQESAPEAFIDNIEVRPILPLGGNTPQASPRESGAR